MVLRLLTCIDHDPGEGGGGTPRHFVCVTRVTKPEPYFRPKKLKIIPFVWEEPLPRTSTYTLKPEACDVILLCNFARVDEILFMKWSVKMNVFTHCLLIKLKQSLTCNHQMNHRISCFPFFMWALYSFSCFLGGTLNIGSGIVYNHECIKTEVQGGRF